MGFVGFLQFSLNCVELFAWPILALVYPLFASIQAIETNSNYHMRKLVTYWILFSLISLFELTFVRFIEWFSIWPYMKIIAICWLVIPRFGHAYNAYKSLVQIRSYANMQAFVNWLIKQDKVTFLKTEETFLSVAEKFIKENGTEALEELISNKSKDTKTNLYAKEKMGVTITEEKEELISNKLKDTKTNLDAKEKMGVTITEKKEELISNKDTKTNLDAKEKMGVTITEKKEELISNKLKDTKTNLDAKEKMEVTITEEKEELISNKSKGTKTNLDAKEKMGVEVKQSNAKLAETERKIPEAVEIKEMNNTPTAKAAGASGEKYYHPSSSSDKVQTHWSCAVCQVTTPSQTVLNSHLQGKKHIAKCKMLEAKKTQTPKNNYSSSSTTSKSGQANQNANKFSFGDRENQSRSKQQQAKKHWCSICNVKCPGEIDLASHLMGKKHLSKVQELFTSLSGAQP